ncbi:hypothetical protein [Sphaerobacter sp.]|uniref:hypothetical protein n=1 Tax=Sphaerobacter sp. TaxID=2099654 RepID=UPI001DD14DA2|nr:hypothetical protein [Sphaerobacter sp.]MBX5445246.1 hypothetical protein [Sphaerobacter sp.]
MAPDRRLVPIVAGLLLGVVGWLVMRRGGAPDAPDTEPESEADPNVFAGLFEEFPETDNPDVVRMFLAWRLAERLAGMTADGAPQDVEKHLKRFGELYKTIARLTR